MTKFVFSEPRTATIPDTVYAVLLNGQPFAYCTSLNDANTLSGYNSAFTIAEGIITIG
jgi:hypothetical protein